MKTTRKLLPLAILAALGLSAGCSVTEQDSGTGGEATVDGLAVDGYLAGAVVYVDTNDNNALDAWEPSAITDGDGYYSFNPNTNTDYCTLPKGDTRRVHCLAVTAALGEVTLRVSGGYDLITKEPFEGTMAVKVDLERAAAGDAVTVNPITSLLDLMDPSAQAQWLSSEGLDEAAVRGDLLNGLAVAEDRSDEADPVTASDLDPVRLAWRIHKLVDVFAARLEAAYDPDQFGTSGQPDDATHFVYQALAEVIAQAQNDSSLTTATILADNNKLQSVLQRAAELISAAGITGTGLSTAEEQDLAAWGVDLATAVTTMFTGVSTKGDLEARARAIEVITALMRDTNNLTLSTPMPAALQNALTLAGDSAYLANLRSNKVDINHLVGRFRNGNGNLTAADADYSARQSLTAQMGIADGTIAGETLSMKNNGDNAALTFNDDGTLSAQIAFNDPDLQIADNQPISGTWEQVDDYTMVLNLEVAEGVTMPVIVKTTVDGNYSFDLGGEQATWLQQSSTP